MVLHSAPRRFKYANCQEERGIHSTGNLALDPPAL